MKKRVTVFTFALSALLMGAALWPYAPPFAYGRERDS
ncbi:hypothetical protein C8C94_4386 [Acidovorax sp. 94]|nr:hypothetical protein C8C94_4386 [Acidovorax sp. 94]